MKAGTSWDAPIHITARPLPEGGYVSAVVKPGTTAYAAIDLEGDKWRFIIFEGLIIDGELRAKRNIQLSQTGTMLQNNNTECGTASEDTAPGPIIFKSMEVKNAWDMNINHGFWVHDIHYIDMNVHSARDQHGGYLRGPRLLVKGGEWHHNMSGIGIQYYMNLAYHYPAYLTLGCPLFEDGVFDGVHFHHNGSNGVWIGQGSKNATVKNVLATNNGAAGIHLQNQYITADNNTAWGNTKPGMRIYSSNVTARNNLLDRIEVSPGLVNVVRENNLVGTTNPGFVDLVGGDFHLTQNSLAVGTGLELPGVEFDFDGIERPMGQSYDIGAFEFVPDTTPPVAPTGVTLRHVCGLSNVEVSWQAVSDAERYAVYHSFNFETYTIFGPIDAGSALSLVVQTGLAVDKYRQFAVTAFDAAGNESELSTIVSTRTKNISCQ
jgi:hypothetical protein